jgi:hypothetical protein
LGPSTAQEAWERPPAFPFTKLNEVPKWVLPRLGHVRIAFEIEGGIKISARPPTLRRPISYVMFNRIHATCSDIWVVPQVEMTIKKLRFGYDSDIPTPTFTIGRSVAISIVIAKESQETLKHQVNLISSRRWSQKATA